jgi:hypothetical protein
MAHRAMRSDMNWRGSSPTKRDVPMMPSVPSAFRGCRLLAPVFRTDPAVCRSRTDNSGCHTLAPSFRPTSVQSSFSSRYLKDRDVAERGIKRRGTLKEVCIAND